MGGRGSGRLWHFDAKNTADDFASIDVRKWHRDGLLKPNQYLNGQGPGNGVTLRTFQVYVETDRLRFYGANWPDDSYYVPLEWTACHLGGKRPWFICPAWGCGRRVAILYGGEIFACRHCYNLAYQSQREAGYDRAVRRADRIREKLGWGPDILNNTGWKPKEMLWRTFARLNAQHHGFARKALAGMVAVR